MTDQKGGSGGYPHHQVSTTLCLLNECLLNSSIVDEELGGGFEAYIRIFDVFYAEGVEVSHEGSDSLLRGKSNVRSLLYSLLVPRSQETQTRTRQALLWTKPRCLPEA